METERQKLKIDAAVLDDLVREAITLGRIYAVLPADSPSATEQKALVDAVERTVLDDIVAAYIENLPSDAPKISENKCEKCGSENTEHITDAVSFYVDRETGGLQLRDCLRCRACWHITWGAFTGKVQTRRGIISTHRIHTEASVSSPG